MFPRREIYLCTRHARRAFLSKSLLVAMLVFCCVRWYIKSILQEEDLAELILQTNFKLRPGSLNGSALVKVLDQPTYIQSAVIEAFESSSTRPVVVVTAWDNSKEPLKCCIIHEDNTLHVTKASLIRQYHVAMLFYSLIELFSYPDLPARELSCPLVSASQSARYLALTTSSCSEEASQYKKIIHVQKHKGELAICGKVAYSDIHEQERLVEWMEYQKLLGVDKVLLFTLRLSPAISNVFNFYVQQGFLEAIPFELPGKPYRGFRWAERVYPQFRHDEQIAIIDCRHRLSGYSHVAGIDLDEIIIPRSGESLKEILQVTLPQQSPNAGAYYFYQSFHITDWNPSNPENQLTTLRYLSTDVPHWENPKFVYRPQQTLYARTHEVFVKSEYTTYIVPTEVAIMHHFRKCPDDWTNCHSKKRITDKSTLRFKGQIERRVKDVMMKLGRTAISSQLH